MLHRAATLNWSCAVLRVVVAEQSSPLERSSERERERGCSHVTGRLSAARFTWRDAAHSARAPETDGDRRRTVFTERSSCRASVTDVKYAVCLPPDGGQNLNNNNNSDASVLSTGSLSALCTLLRTNLSLQRRHNTTSPGCFVFLNSCYRGETLKPALCCDPTWKMKLVADIVVWFAVLGKCSAV